MRAGGRQFLMQGVAEAASFVNGVYPVADGDLCPDPIDQLGASELLGRSNDAALELHGDDHIAQVHVQTELEDLAHWNIASRSRVVSVGVVMKGWVDDLSFHISACARFAHATALGYLRKATASES